MIHNNHSAGDPSPEKRRKSGLGEKAGAALCFAILGALHLALINAADLSGRARTIEAPRLMVFDFLPPAAPEAIPPEAAPVEAAPAQVLAAKAPAAAPAPALSPEAPAPAPPEAPAEEGPPAKLLPPPAPLPGLAKEGPAGGLAGPSGGRGGAAFAGRRPVMSDAEYIALVMRRLEEKKIYPLSMRKRGIAGDAEALFTIRPDGSLGSLRAGEGPAHPFLVQAALETVRSAAPFPVMEGRREEYSLRVTIRFQLE